MRSCTFRNHADGETSLAYQVMLNVLKPLVPRNPRNRHNGVDRCYAANKGHCSTRFSHVLVSTWDRSHSDCFASPNNPT